MFEAGEYHGFLIMWYFELRVFIFFIFLFYLFIFSTYNFFDSEMKVIEECSLLNFLERMLANHICHIRQILERVMKTQKSQCSKQAARNLPYSLTHASHSVPRNADVWPQNFKNK
jgi:hypothetical protein